MDRLFSEELNELRQSERHQLNLPTQDPHLSKHYSSHRQHGQTALGELSAGPLWLLALAGAHRNLLSFYCIG